MKRHGLSVKETAFKPREKQRKYRGLHMGFNKLRITNHLKSSQSVLIKIIIVCIKYTVFGMFC